MTVNRPCCIDIDHDNNISDNPTPLAGLDQVKKTGVFALIHKATEGTSFRDQHYDTRCTKWMSGSPISTSDIDGTLLTLSPLWGAYHFFHGSDPKGESSNFLMTSRLNLGDLPFLDWEAVGASGFQPSIEAADAFCQAVEASLGRVCGVYGGNVPRERFGAEKASSEVLERFSKRPLWFCAYGPVKDLTLLPEPWKETGAFLWQDDGDQYGPGPHVMPGISGYCDNSTVPAPTTFSSFHDQWLMLAGIKPAEPLTPKPADPNIESFIKSEVEAFETKLEQELKEKFS
jgi:lysozyme